MEQDSWEKISGRIKAVFNFGIEKSEWLKTSKMARFIAEIPYLAGCKKAEETAFSHLAIYIMSIEESSKDIFFHKPEDDDDILLRLAPISNFVGGDRVIIDCCMALISLCMISNYRKDQENDKKIGKYNPLGEGKWDYEKLSSELMQTVEKNLTPEIEKYYTAEDTVRGFWQK